MGVQLLLAIATAFLAAALGAIATAAAPPLLVSFFAVAAASAGVAILWQWRPFRAWLPFAKPWKMRLEVLWAEGNALRTEMMTISQDETNWTIPAPPAETPSAELQQRTIDWEDRVWDALASEHPERAGLLIAEFGGRLAKIERLSMAELDRRTLRLTNLVGQFISGTI